MASSYEKPDINSWHFTWEEKYYCQGIKPRIKSPLCSLRTRVTHLTHLFSRHGFVLSHILHTCAMTLAITSNMHTTTSVEPLWNRLCKERMECHLLKEENTTWMDSRKQLDLQHFPAWQKSNKIFIKAAFLKTFLGKQQHIFDWDRKNYLLLSRTLFWCSVQLWQLNTLATATEYTIADAFPNTGGSQTTYYAQSYNNYNKTIS